MRRRWPLASSWRPRVVRSPRRAHPLRSGRRLGRDLSGRYALEKWRGSNSHVQCLLRGFGPSPRDAVGSRHSNPPDSRPAAKRCWRKASGRDLAVVSVLRLVGHQADDEDGSQHGQGRQDEVIAAANSHLRRFRDSTPNHRWGTDEVTVVERARIAWPCLGCRDGSDGETDGNRDSAAFVTHRFANSVARLSPCRTGGAVLCNGMD